MSARQSETGSPRKIWPANARGIDYVDSASKLGPPPIDIIDAHTHIHGRHATAIYNRARKLFGITRTYTMSQYHMSGEVRDVLGDSVRFIAMPQFSAEDRRHAHRGGYCELIEKFHKDFGARMMKIWASPRLREIAPPGMMTTDLADIDSPWRREHARVAVGLGMMIMVHVADPDSYFRTKYRDVGTYGTKEHQYVGLRRMLDLFPVPWIAAHMGGWPENLAFLDSMLHSHPNLHIDTSATKWMVRELSKHPRAEVVAFFEKWRTRILFGSDLVTLDDQLSPNKTGMSVMADLSNSPEEAFELYCSRYFALRTMFETTYVGPSPIADPDVALDNGASLKNEQGLFVPRLQGLGLSKDVLMDVYARNTLRVVDGWWAGHGG